MGTLMGDLSPPSMSYAKEQMFWILILVKKNLSEGVSFGGNFFCVRIFGCHSKGHFKMPPHRKIEFSIDLVSNTSPISETP